MPDITRMEMIPAEDGEALTKHPDVTLKAGELFVCSCGTTWLRMWPLVYTLSGVRTEKPVTSWCPECGDTACWEPPDQGERS